MSMLVVSGVRRDFGGLTAVQNLSFTVEPGEIVGLIGPNGAGKTTTFAMLAGFLTPTSGEILFQGKRINEMKPHQVCKLGLTRTFQIVQPFPDMTALENIMVGAYVRHPRTTDAKHKAMEVLKRVDLSHKADTLGKNLTLIELKRLEIGKALATEPSLLLLDEVAAGLKDAEVDNILLLVRQLNKEGITFLIVEHLMKVIMNLSQRVIVLDFGQMIAQGTPQEISKDPAVLAAYLGKEE
ncbi:MAG TPA: ABC transporter ATP-binding protein [Anaerolineales bacterium]|nr:ABC transporter ATP-binding protein [Anaerolineales bacterium]